MNEALWYFGRASGVTALVLFTVVVVLGIVVRTARPLPGLPRFAVLGVHRAVSLAALAFLVLHVALLTADPYAQLRLADAVVPFVGSYRPLWLGLGTVAFDLVVVLIVSSLLRNRLGPRVWRTLHLTSYAMWPVAVVHALGTGTDRGSAWLVTVVLVCLASVAAGLFYRVVSGRREPAPERFAPPSDLAGLPVANPSVPAAHR